MANSTISGDVQQLEPGDRVELFEVDATLIGGDIDRFHGHLQTASIFWQGNEYRPWPVTASGFLRTGDAQQPAPTVSLGNQGGYISALCVFLDDMVDAKVTRHRTFVRYLDARNFPGGNPTADPAAEYAPEIWYVSQKTGETDETVEFTLASALSLDGQQLPARPIVANVCGWLTRGGYRGKYCAYAGEAMFDANDNPTTDPGQDKCGGRLSSCRVRPWPDQVINFGSFPAATLTAAIS